MLHFYFLLFVFFIKKDKECNAFQLKVFGSMIDSAVRILRRQNITWRILIFSAASIIYYEWKRRNVWS